MAGILAWIAQSGVVQGIIIGATLAFLTAILTLNLVARRLTTTDNGWSSIRRCGRLDNGVLARAACAKALPAVNVFEEAAYWKTTRDAAGRPLTGAQSYLLHFPPGQLPPHRAFWSLTVTDTVGYMVADAAGPAGIDDRVELAQGADGAVDIVLRHDPPPGAPQNWLAVPSGRFSLMLRVYLPGSGILDGSYRVPPVVRAAELATAV
nr:DUF1214 domain-containing protein [Microbacterium bovistercoris]